MKLTPFNFGSGIFQVPEEGKEDFDLLNPQGELEVTTWTILRRHPWSPYQFSLGSLGRKTDYWYAYRRATFGGKITGQ